MYTKTFFVLISIACSVMAMVCTAIALNAPYLSDLVRWGPVVAELVLAALALRDAAKAHPKQLLWG